MCLTIMATPGVVTMSRSITSMPVATSADAAASRTQNPLGRESRPKTTRNRDPCPGCCVSYSHAANAAAMCDMTSGVSVPPTVPRMPETPIISASMRRYLEREIQMAIIRPYAGASQEQDMNQADLEAQLAGIVDAPVADSAAHPEMQHLDRVKLPSPGLVVIAVERLRQLVFPGYFNERDLSADNFRIRTEAHHCAKPRPDSLNRSVAACAIAITSLKQTGMVKSAADRGRIATSRRRPS